jgi:GT2 family glycosyltransferase
MSLKIAAIVVTHNRPKLLAQCVDALRSQTRRPDWVIVVGNDVCSQTRAWLDQRPDVLAVNLYKIPAALNLQANQKILNRSLKAGFKSRFVKPHHLFSSGRVPISRFTSRKTG